MIDSLRLVLQARTNDGRLFEGATRFFEVHIVDVEDARVLNGLSMAAGEEEETDDQMLVRLLFSRLSRAVIPVEELTTNKPEDAPTTLLELLRNRLLSAMGCNYHKVDHKSKSFRLDAAYRTTLYHVSLDQIGDIEVLRDA